MLAFLGVQQQGFKVGLGWLGQHVWLGFENANAYRETSVADFVVCVWDQENKLQPQTEVQNWVGVIKATGTDLHFFMKVKMFISYF